MEWTQVIVAVRQGHLMGTAFHPEITADTRWRAPTPTPTPATTPTDTFAASPPAPLSLAIDGQTGQARRGSEAFGSVRFFFRFRHKLFAAMCANGPGPEAKGGAAPSTANVEVPYIKPPPLPVR